MAGCGVYIHWPFCRSKCPYCDFFSRVRKDVPQDKLVDGYLEEMDFYAEMTGPREITSVFFGGGTPSLLSPQNIERLLDYISKKWRLAKEAEISLEANPNSRHSSLFADLKQAGINRLSLGVQSLHDEDLNFLGRTHTAAEALSAIEEILRLFDNHSADLIYALPNQDIEVWEKDLRFVFSLGLKHLSLYQLTIEEGTVFAKKGVEPMTEEPAAEFYQRTGEAAAAAGYPRYEVSNFCRPGFECRHNLLYWEGGDYIGIGEGAHGRLTCGGDFFATTYRCRVEKLTSRERAEELLLTGLRLEKGIDKKNFEKICGLKFDVIIGASKRQQLRQLGLIEDSPARLKATSAGRLLLDRIVEELWS